MRVKAYNGFKQAFKAIIPEDQEYPVVWHKLGPGDSVGEHFHPKANEWAVIDSETEISLDFENQEIEGRGTRAVHFPSGYIHSMKANKGMVYFVIRDGIDDIIYLEDVLKTRPSIKPEEDACGLLWNLHNSENLSIAYAEVAAPARRHKHQKMQEKYRIEKGEGQLFIGNKVLDISKGDVIKIPKNSWHYLKRVKRKPLEVLVITHPKYDPSDRIFE